MDSMTFLLGLGIMSMTGLVGIALYLSNKRALDRMTQESLNYRAELRAGGSTAPSRQEEPDLLSTLMIFAQQNPEMVKQFLGGLQQQQGQQPSGILGLSGNEPK